MQLEKFNNRDKDREAFLKRINLLNERILKEDNAKYLENTFTE